MRKLGKVNWLKEYLGKVPIQVNEWGEKNQEDEGGGLKRI